MSDIHTNRPESLIGNPEDIQVIDERRAIYTEGAFLVDAVIVQGE